MAGAAVLGPHGGRGQLCQACGEGSDGLRLPCGGVRGVLGVLGPPWLAWGMGSVLGEHVQMAEVWAALPTS